MAIMRFYLFPIFTLLTCTTQAQVAFTDASQQILDGKKLYSLAPMAVNDLDNDGKDDVIFLDKGKVLNTFIQKGQDEAFNFKQHAQLSTFGDFSLISGDLNNDSIPEIISSGNENGSDICFKTGILYSSTYNTDNIFSQASNLVDLNNDGFLDLFVCNDVGENRTYLNDQSGLMSKVNLIDFKTSPEDDMSGNYSSMFSDIDNDGDLDLYIGKCRAGVSSPEDRRRINTLYINNGDGTYYEDADARGLASGSQTWSVDFGDVDNDGDQDVFLANHGAPHELLLNDGNGYFIPYPVLDDDIYTFAIQSFFADFDNNGWPDIMVLESNRSFILYNHEMSFSYVPFANDGEYPFTGAYGDFNSDGFLDMIVGFAKNINDIGSTPDAVLLNEGNANNHIRINLEGTASNLDAIGAKVMVIGGNEHWTQEIQCGESYGVMNSNVAHFGLGQVSGLDSILVFWPSGNVSIFTEDLEVNRLINISENGCFTINEIMPIQELCGGAPIDLGINGDYDVINWSTGASASMITVSEPQEISVDLWKEGCLVRTIFYTIVNEDSASQVIQDQKIQSSYCSGQTVTLSAADAQTYEWSTGETSKAIDITDSGVFNVSITTNCGFKISADYTIEFAELPVITTKGDSILIGETASLFSSGENPKWFDSKYSESVIFEGNTFITPSLSETTSYFVQSDSQAYAFSKNLMPVVPLFDSGNPLHPENDTLSFSVLTDVYIESIKVRAKSDGMRQVEIFNQLGEVIFSKNADYQTGINTININLELEKGGYRITTNANVNVSELGTNHPGFSGSDLYQSLDKRVQDYLEIGESSFIAGYTPYFFDWDIDFGSVSCGEKVEVVAFVDIDSSTEDDNLSNTIKLYPNPSSGSVSIELPNDSEWNISLFTIQGILVKRHSEQSNLIQIGLEDVLPGIYLLSVASEEGMTMKKLIVE